VAVAELVAELLEEAVVHIAALEHLCILFLALEGIAF
jgi:hypothetical protein